MTTIIASLRAGSTSLRRTALAVGLAALAGCSTDSILTIERPDIIDPSNLDSPLGATALYNGAIGDMAYAQGTFGGLMLAQGLFSDEFRFGGTPPEVRQFDLGDIKVENSFSQTIWLNLHRGRQAAEKAAVALAKFGTADPRIAEMKALAALATIWIGETYCSGTPFSDYGPPETYGDPLSTQQTFERALGLLTGLTTTDARITNLIAVLKGRALLDNGQYATAAAAVATVPTDFVYQTLFSSVDARTQNTMKGFEYDFDYLSVSDNEGGNGLNFVSAHDPRVPTTQDFGPVSRFDGKTPMYQFPKYNSFDSPIVNASGIEARLIEAEAALQAGDLTGWLDKLNALRAQFAGPGTLAPLADPGTAAGRVDLMFRERAFWMFATAHRIGDMRRLVRQYGRTVTSVFPTGAYHKDNLTRGNQASIIIPQTENNNPQYDPSVCDPHKA